MLRNFKMTLTDSSRVHQLPPSRRQQVSISHRSIVANSTFLYSVAKVAGVVVGEYHDKGGGESEY